MTYSLGNTNPSDIAIFCSKKVLSPNPPSLNRRKREKVEKREK